MQARDAVWAALSHPARRSIVDALRIETATSGALHARLEREGASPSRFATQRHLQVLREADLVLVTQRGRERLNALNASALFQATIGWLEPESARTAHALDGLKRLAEAPAPSPTAPTPTAKEQRMTEFHITQAIDIAAEPARVWQALVEEPAAWWGAPYQLLDGPSSFELPLQCGAAVVERQGDASALWGHVSAVTPGSVYAWLGQMGMGAGAWGEVRYELEATDAGTRVTLTHDSALLWDDDAAGARASYDYGWADLNARLKAFVETGAKHGTAGTNAEPEFVFEPSS
ncbi:helix-turn-helix domain-containing protein [Agrococcus baldri]|nr:helix-turn-helix domain-containing protein [Agrococcus baldri]